MLQWIKNKILRVWTLRLKLPINWSYHYSAPPIWSTLPLIVSDKFAKKIRELESKTNEQTKNKTN